MYVSKTPSCIPSMQVWCRGSGCIGTVVYGLYGSATLLFGMSNKARATLMFPQFWAVLTLIVNGKAEIDRKAEIDEA